MRAWPSLLTAVAVLVLGACASDERQWMKVNQPYSTQEFRRDFAECSARGSLDEICMRARGWVTVNPSKRETPTPEPERPRRY
jgi:hypothetical protein